MNEFVSLFRFHDHLQKISLKALGSFSKLNNLQNMKKNPTANHHPCLCKTRRVCVCLIPGNVGPNRKDRSARVNRQDNWYI